MRKPSAFIMLAASSVLATSPAVAQNSQWYQDQYNSQENDRGKTERVLCDVEKAARILSNVANAIQDRGGYNYNGFGGHNDCQQNFRQEYRQNYRLQDERYHQNTYQSNGGNNFYQPRNSVNPFDFPGNAGRSKIDLFGNSNNFQSAGPCLRITIQGNLVGC